MSSVIKLSQHFISNLFLHPEEAKSVTPLEWQSLILVLRKSQLLARFGLLFDSAEVLSALPQQVQRHFKNAITLAGKQRKQVQYESLQLVKFLNQKSIQLVFLKGAGYTLADNAPALGRVYSDIDILVKKHDLLSVEQNLAFTGWFAQELNDYDERYYREWAHEIPPLAHGVRGTVLDIHHNIVPLVSGRSINVDVLLGYTQVLDSGIIVLNSAAMTVHSFIHLFFNEEFSSGYRDMTDLFLLMDNQNEAYWQDVVTISTNIGFTKELALALRYAELYFGFNAPAFVKNASVITNVRISLLEDFIFKRVLAPKHPLVDVRWKGLAELLGLIRGHWLKMPIHILIPHLFVKGYRSLAESLFGEHIFTKKSPEMADNLGENLKK